MPNIKRRKFIKQAAALAPILIFGLNGCKANIDLKVLKNIGYPSIKNNSVFKLDDFLETINYTGKEHDSDLLKTLLNQIEIDFKSELTAFFNGWQLSRTELVLLNLGQYD
ncbi:MAG: hypothetical protein ACPGLV_19155 [Bacteroidia bacterium]